MPISLDTEFQQLSQSEFADISYRVMAEVFTIHRELGRLFDEDVYRDALRTQIDDLQTEVRIGVSYRDFSKSYFMAAVVASGAVFELKAGTFTLPVLRLLGNNMEAVGDQLGAKVEQAPDKSH